MKPQFQHHRLKDEEQTALDLLQHHYPELVQHVDNHKKNI